MFNFRKNGKRERWVLCVAYSIKMNIFLLSFSSFISTQKLRLVWMLLSLIVRDLTCSREWRTYVSSFTFRFHSKTLKHSAFEASKIFFSSSSTSPPPPSFTCEATSFSFHLFSLLSVQFKSHSFVQGWFSFSHMKCMIFKSPKVAFYHPLVIIISTTLRLRILFHTFLVARTRKWQYYF